VNKIKRDIKGIDAAAAACKRAATPIVNAGFYVFNTENAILSIIGPQQARASDREGGRDKSRPMTFN
jgi:hypothetical protein